MTANKPDNIAEPQPFGVLDKARKAVPAVNYALGVAGIAAAGAIVVAFLGSGRGAVIILGGMFIAMVLLFAFSRLVAAGSKQAARAGVVVMWMIVAFFGTFLAFTVTAVAVGQPAAWARLLGLEQDEPDSKTQAARLVAIPPDVIARTPLGPPSAGIELVRLLVRLPDGPESDRREGIVRGGGAYYAFLRRTHQYGDGSDIQLYRPSTLHTGFAGADYGFFLPVGQGSMGDLAALKADAPPTSLDPARIEAWKYVIGYAPPRQIRKVRDEQRKSRGFQVGATTLSAQATVVKGGLYLLRSILFDRSDVLVAFNVVEVLQDDSAVLAWRILKVYENPVIVDRQD